MHWTCQFKTPGPHQKIFLLSSHIEQNSSVNKQALWFCIAATLYAVQASLKKVGSSDNLSRIPTLSRYPFPPFFEAAQKRKHYQVQTCTIWRLLPLPTQRTRPFNLISLLIEILSCFFMPRMHFLSKILKYCFEIRGHVVIISAAFCETNEFSNLFFICL